MISTRFFALLLVGASSYSAATDFNFREIPSLAEGTTYASAINNDGVAVVRSHSDKIGYRDPMVYLYQNGGTTTLNFKPGMVPDIAAINGKKIIVGSGLHTYQPNQTVRHAFIYDANTKSLKWLSAFGNLSRSSEATDINSSGQVVGTANYNTAFVYQNGVMKSLGTLGGSISAANAINDSGKIVGGAELPADQDGNERPHAFLYENGKMKDLGAFGGLQSWAADINNAGQIVGSYWTTNREHAFLYANGKKTDLGTLPGSEECRATSINDHGDIVGYCDGGLRSFLYRNGVMTDLTTEISV